MPLPCLDCGNDKAIVGVDIDGRPIWACVWCGIADPRGAHICQVCLEPRHCVRVAVLDYCESPAVWTPERLPYAPVYRNIEVCELCQTMIKEEGRRAAEAYDWEWRAGGIILYEDVLDAEFVF